MTLFDPIIIVRADRLALAHGFTSTETTRPYLGGVYVRWTDAGVHLVATDGVRLGLFLDADGGAPTEGRIIELPKEALKVCLSAKRRDAPQPWFVMAADGSAMIVQVTSETPPRGDIFAATSIKNLRLWQGDVDIIDGTFPEYAHVIPREVSGDASEGFDASLLKPFEAAVKSSSNLGSPMRIEFNGAGPMLITGARADFLGVLMPMRTCAHAPNDIRDAMFNRKPISRPA